MESINFDRTIRYPFILDKEKIESLSKILQNRLGELSISAVCTDDADRSFESVDKLLDYDNIKSRRVISLSLFSRKYTSKETRRIKITYRAKSRITQIHGITEISVNVSGSKEWASMTMQELCEAVAGSRPWYSWISKINEAIFTVLFTVIFYFILVRTGIFSSFSTPEEVIIPLLYILISAFWTAVGVKSYVIGYLFPPGIYLIGHEKKRHEIREKMRWLFIALVLTAVLTTVLSIVL